MGSRLFKINSETIIDMIRFLSVIWIFSMLPPGVVANLGIAQLLGAIKVGFLVLGPFDLVVPLIFLSIALRPSVIGLFYKAHPSLTWLFSIFCVWSLMLISFSLISGRVGQTEVVIGLLRLTKFIASAMWCPLVYNYCRDRRSGDTMQWVMYIAILLVAISILGSANQAYQVAEARSSAAGTIIVLKEDLPFSGNSASVLLATSSAFFIAAIVKRTWQILLVLPLLVALFTTTGRAGYLGLFSAIVYILIRNRKFSSAAIALIITLVVYVLSFIPIIGAAISTMLGKGDSDILFMESNGRVAIYDFFINEIALEKLFFGSGFGVWGGGSGLPEHTMHNFFLQMWAESGVIGMLLCVWLTIEMIRQTKSNIRTGKCQEFNRYYIVGFRAALIAVFFASMTETYLYGGPILSSLCAYLGLALARTSLGSPHQNRRASLTLLREKIT